MITIDAVLFDFDGTLAPNLDLPDMRRQVVERSLQAGIPEAVFAELYIVEIIEAGHAWLCAHDSAKASHYKHSAEQLIVDIEIGAAATTDVFAGVTDMLTGLRSRGIKLGIVTRNCRAAIDAVFPEHHRYVDALHARDDVIHLKPDPRHLLANLSALAARPANSIMVGDGVLDMRAGRELDMHCIGVLTGSNDAAALTEAGANEVQANCLQLHKFLT